MSHRWAGFSSTVTVKEAQDKFYPELPKFNLTESIPIFQACDRKLSSKIIAPRSLPGFRRSAMDGYALVASSTHGASDTNPIQLKIAGKIDIGDTKLLKIQSGEAIRIATGAPVPDDATAVIKIENCEELDDILEVYTPVAKGKNIAEEDEDVEIGEEILSLNHLVKPWDVSLLLSLGITTVDVYQKPRIAIISTGNELISVNEEPILGQVVDSNRTALEMWVRHLGGQVIFSDTVSDEIESIKRVLSSVPNCDLILTTGGTSVGTHDYMLEVVEELGKIYIRGVSIRPGKPVILGKIKEIPIIALPGYPLAAFLNFNLFAVPILQKITGLSNYWDNEYTTTLSQSIASRAGIRDFARLKDVGGEAELIRITGAGILSSLTRADFLLEIPEDREGYAKGDQVKVKKVKN